MKKTKPPDEIARNMSAIRATGARTEKQLRSVLHGMGFRFRKNYSGLPGKPDIVFTKERIAVFIDGDYWHGRQLKERGAEYLHAYFTEKQQEYWNAKLKRNVERDVAVTDELTRENWNVIRLWESDVRRYLMDTALQLADVVLSRRMSIEQHRDEWT